MATYHFSVKVGSKGKGASGASHSMYIERDGKYSERNDLQDSWSANIPEWADSPQAFWKSADKNERVNGAVYREFEIALPRELDPEQRRHLVEQFCNEHLGTKHAYTAAIHNPAAALDGGEQPHAHVMFSERRHDINLSEDLYFSRNGGGKDRVWVDRETLPKLRESWASHVNEAYKEHGINQAVTHKSLAAQGLDRERERHLGPKAIYSKERVREVKEIRSLKAELKDLDKELTLNKKPVREAVRPVERPVFEPVKPEPAQPEKPLSPVDQVQQINDRQHTLFKEIDLIESQYRQGLPDYAGRIKTVEAEVSAAVKVERIAGKELEAWAKYGEKRGWKEGQSFQRPTGLFAGKEKEAFDRWKADYDQKAEKSLEATQTRIGVERSVERKVQNIRQEQGSKEAEIKKRIEADPRIAEAMSEIRKGMDQKERIEHPERSQSRSRDRGGIDMEM